MSFEDKRNLPATYADVAMFRQEGFGEVDPTVGVIPSVRLLSMTEEPLAAIASMCAMYEGRVIRDYSELNRSDLERYFADVQATHLQAPLESVRFQFLLEGVDRAFTHQLVRARLWGYAQESLRFAVVDDLASGTSLPPSLYGTQFGDVPWEEYKRQSPEEKKLQEMRRIWDEALGDIQGAYSALIDQGMPAEEARGLLPQATTTRVIMICDLRSLADHAGNRLCTQAQFHWRAVFSQIVSAIRAYGDSSWSPTSWQYKAIADSPLFRPKCYQLGHCPFKASFDRACSIRGRVDDFASEGIPSSEWDSPLAQKDGFAIDTREWLMDPSAAIRRPQ